MTNFEKRMVTEADHRGVLGYTSGNERFDEETMEPLERERPKMKDFREEYSPEEIADDQARIREIENSPDYQRERSSASVMAEALLIDCIPSREWLGEDVTTCPTNKFDDICRGTDFIITIVDPDNPDEDVVFGIDVTVSDKGKVLHDKVMKESYKIKDDKRTEIKYFKGVDKINRYVVGVDPARVEELAEVSLEKPDKPVSIEKQISLELAQELSYQAYRQLRLLILLSTKLSLRNVNSPEEMAEFISENNDDIEKDLTNNATDTYKDNRSILRYMNTLITENKKEVEQSGPTSYAVEFLTSYEDDDRLVSYQRQVA